MPPQSWGCTVDGLVAPGEKIGGSGVKLEPGDVVGCVCDLEHGELVRPAYHEPLHTATRGSAKDLALAAERAGYEKAVVTVHDVHPHGGLVLITIDGDTKVLVNFGERPLHALRGVRISAALQAQACTVLVTSATVVAVVCCCRSAHGPSCREVVFLTLDQRCHDAVHGRASRRLL